MSILTLTDRIKNFIGDKRESDGGYSKVTTGDWEELHCIIRMILEEKWEEDCDGDLPVSFVLVNKHTHFMNHIPVPHPSYIKDKDDLDNYLRCVSVNLDISSGEQLYANALVRELLPKDIVVR